MFQNGEASSGTERATAGRSAAAIAMARSWPASSNLYGPDSIAVERNIGTHLENGRDTPGMKAGDDDRPLSAAPSLSIAFRRISGTACSPPTCLRGIGFKRRVDVRHISSN
jgi:hypothetical protein